MKELEFYFGELFKKSEQFDSVRRALLFVVLVMLSFSFYASGTLLYGLAVASALLQCIALFLDFKSQEFRGLANDFQKNSMLIGIFNRVLDVDELTILRIKAGNDVGKAVREKLDGLSEVAATSYLKIEANPMKKLIEMIRENSYWNNHLYRFSYEPYKSRFLFVVLLGVVAALSLIPNVALDSEFTVLRLLFAVMSFGVIFEIFAAAVKYKRSSAEMDAIGHKIERMDFLDAQEALSIFAKYHLIKASTPPIPLLVYTKNRDMLNHCWRMRVEGLTCNTTKVSCESAVRCREQ